jgi:hypothetical protein
MSAMKKAHCPMPEAVAATCQAYLAETRPQTLAKGWAALIAEGVVLIAERRPSAENLATVCRRKHAAFDAALSTHIQASVREQARHLRRARGLPSLQELYLEAVLAALIKHGFLGPDLTPTAPPRRAA